MGSDVNVPEEAVEALGKSLGAMSHCGALEIGPIEVRKALEAAAPAICAQERERVDAALRSIPGFLPDAAFFQKFYARLATLDTEAYHAD